MLVKREYKHTDIGPLPVDWHVAPLDDVLTRGQLGGNYANSESESEWPLIKMGNLGRGRILLNRIEYVRGPRPPAIHDRLHRGDVLLNTRNTAELVGKVAIWNDELPQAYFNSNIMRLTFDPRRVGSNRFMCYALNTSDAVARMRGLATGTTSVAAVYTRDLRKFLVQLPPAAEQRSIGEILSDVDALISALQDAIRKKRHLRHGAIQVLLTGQRRLPGFTGEWRERPLGAIVRLRRDLAPPSPGVLCVELENLEPGSGRLVAAPDAVKNSTPRSRVHVGDVLFGRLRPYLRKYWLATQDAVCSTEFWVMVADRRVLDPRFLQAIVASEMFVQAASTTYGTHMPRSDWSVVNDLSVRLPTPEEQAAIGTALGDMDAEIDALEQRIAKARELKEGMMQELLTGRIRLGS